MIIWNLQKLTPNKWSESSLLEYDYKKLAEKCILKWGGQQKYLMLRDPDALDFVCTFLLFSAVNYKGNKGWSLYSYVCKCGKFAIKKWKFKQLNRRRFKQLNEECKIYLDDQLENFIKNEEILQIKEQIQQIPLLLDYYNGLSIDELSQKYSLSKQNIYNSIKYDINKIKKKFSTV